MAAKGKFAPVRNGDPTLQTIQDSVRDVFDQLEFHRRGLLSSVTRVVTGPGEQLAEDTLVVFTGKGPITLKLPVADLLGRGRGWVIFLQHAGTGVLTLPAVSTNTVNGVATLALAAGTAVALVSDGVSRWQAVGGAGGDVSSYKHSPGGSGLTAWFLASVAANAPLGTGTAGGANLMNAVPFIAPRRGGTLDTLAFEVTTLLAGNGRVGCWDTVSESNLYPNNLLADGGSISTATTGVKSATVSVPLCPGAMYWLSYVGSAAATLRTLTASNVSHVLGVPATLGGVFNVGVFVAFAFGALPTKFPAGGSYSTGSGSPALAGRIS